MKLYKILFLLFLFYCFSFNAEISYALAPIGTIDIQENLISEINKNSRKPKNISALLEQYGKEKLKGLTVFKAAQLIGVAQPSLWYHMNKHPECYRKYGIKKPRKSSKPFLTSGIPEALKNLEVKKITGLNVQEVAELISYDRDYLLKFLQRNPEYITTYGIIINKRQPRTLLLLQKIDKSKLKGLSVEQVSAMIGISVETLLQYPDELIAYGIIFPCSSIHYRLKMQDHNTFKGKNILQAAKILRIHHQSMVHYFKYHPDELKTCGIKKGKRSSTKNKGRQIKTKNQQQIFDALTNKSAKHLKGLTVSEAARVVGITPRQLHNYFSYFPNEIKRFGIIKRKYTKSTATSL